MYSTDMRNRLSILLIAYHIQTCVTHRFVKNHWTVNVFLVWKQGASSPSVRAFATFETASPTAEARSGGRSDNLGICALGITSVCPALKGRISMQLYERNALQVNRWIPSMAITFSVSYTIWAGSSPLIMRQKAQMSFWAQAKGTWRPTWDWIMKELIAAGPKISQCKCGTLIWHLPPTCRLHGLNLTKCLNY